MWFSNGVQKCSLLYANTALYVKSVLVCYRFGRDIYSTYWISEVPITKGHRILDLPEFRRDRRTAVYAHGYIEDTDSQSVRTVVDGNSSSSFKLAFRELCMMVSLYLFLVQTEVVNHFTN